MKNAREMTDKELTDLIRGVIDAVDKGGPEDVSSLVQPLRDIGVVPGNFRGDAASESVKNGLMWYAGEILDIVDRKSWFAMNSIINCKDKFAPELP